MARGNQRDKAREKNEKDKAGMVYHSPPDPLPLPSVLCIMQNTSPLPKLPVLQTRRKGGFPKPPI